MEAKYMVRNDILYRFCKKYTNRYEQCEEEAKNVLIDYLRQGYGGEDAEDKLHESGILDEIFSQCAISKAELQALIVDDFVKQLDEELQMKIIMHCVGVKCNEYEVND